MVLLRNIIYEPALIPQESMFLNEVEGPIERQRPSTICSVWTVPSQVERDRRHLQPLFVEQNHTM
jgi:hypothetical protein